VQSCTQGAFVSFLLSFGFRVGRLAVGGDVFFSSCICCGVCTLGTGLRGLSVQVLLGAARGVGRGGSIFLSANRRAQGALLLFLLS